MATANIKVSPEFNQIMSEAVVTLKKANMNSFATDIDTMARDVNRQRFTVAVVGEFSRGKSSFINKMFGRELLPVANMPTTAMLTRIRYSAKEAITVVDSKTRTQTVLPISPDSWTNYVADMSGNDPSGVAFVGIDNPWLKNGIEIIDTPGAGDLEEKRAALIGDALNGSDSAIITVSAERAMSMSEKLFIEERLISKKTPFLMLVITKLDLIDIAQRDKIIDFVKTKLSMWKMNNIPVYVPYKIEMPNDRYDSIIGMDKVVNRLNDWMLGSDRKKLTEQWLALKLSNSLQSAIDAANEQKCLISSDSESKKQQLIEQKTEMLARAEDKWKEIVGTLKLRADECYDLFLEKATEYRQSMVEKLQYELSHTGNVKKWWTEDYPYRLKIEMTNMSVAMENAVSRRVTKDIMWLNSSLEKNFKTSVVYTPEDITDKETYTQFDINSDVKVKDLSSGRTISRIGITALSITAALTCSFIGVASIIGTMGVSTGGSVLTEGIFKKKIEDQKDIVKREIANCTPKVVDNAMAYSERRAKNIYADLATEATKKQTAWMENQKNIIAAAKDNSGEEGIVRMDSVIDSLSALLNKIDKHTSN